MEVSTTTLKRAFRLYEKQQGLTDTAATTRWLRFLAILKRENTRKGKTNGEDDRRENSK